MNTNIEDKTAKAMRVAEGSERAGRFDDDRQPRSSGSVARAFAGVPPASAAPGRFQRTQVRAKTKAE